MSLGIICSSNHSFLFELRSQETVSVHFFAPSRGYCWSDVVFEGMKISLELFILWKSQHCRLHHDIILLCTLLLNLEFKANLSIQNRTWSQNQLNQLTLQRWRWPFWWLTLLSFQIPICCTWRRCLSDNTFLNGAVGVCFSSHIRRHLSFQKFLE